MFNDSADGVRLHVFPEHRTQARDVPAWMQQSRGSVKAVRFGEEVQTSRDPQPSHGEESAENLRVDPLAEERAALKEQRAALISETAALDAVRTDLEGERGALAAAAAALSAARADAQQTNTDQLAEIALAVIRVIITDAFSEAPERAGALAEAALAPDSEATLRVGPALHIALLESGKASIAVLDASLAPYGCIAESPSRRVIAGLEDRLGEVLRALKEAT